jgi:hypothetical protein
MRCLQLRIPRFTGKGAGGVKLPVAAALADSAFAARRFLIPIQISIPCRLGSVPVPAGDRHHGHREISLDACLYATLETNN